MNTSTDSGVGHGNLRIYRHEDTAIYVHFKFSVCLQFKQTYVLGYNSDIKEAKIVK